MQSKLAARFVGIFILCFRKLFDIIQGTARRKKKIIHRPANADDKKLQSSLKKLAANNIQGIEEVFNIRELLSKNFIFIFNRLICLKIMVKLFILQIQKCKHHSVQTHLLSVALRIQNVNIRLL
jgi:hypothetical protein